MIYSEEFQNKAQEIVTWAEQYINEGNDGFKGEIVWLATEFSIVAEYLDNIVFLEPAVAELVNKLCNKNYTSSRSINSTFNEYEIEQQKATDAYVENTAYVPIFDGTESTNYKYHKILWATGFGGVSLSQHVGIVDGMSSSSEDDTAKILFANILVGRSVSDEDLYNIVTSTLSKLTYHEQLVACLAYKYKEKLLV